MEHHAEWFKAIVEGDHTLALSNFDYAGPLTETVLLGGVATRFPHTTLEWNAADLKFNLAEASQFLRRKYRQGWEVAGL